MRANQRRKIAHLIVGLVLGAVLGVAISPVVEHMVVASKRGDRMNTGEPS